MLLHQSIGLERFNELPRAKAIHALYECCCSMTWAGWVSDGRPFRTYAEILARAEDALLDLSDSDVERALQCHPPVGLRAQSAPSHLEQCSIWVADEQVMASVRSVELAKITRTRIERMLGPEDGYPEY